MRKIHVGDTVYFETLDGKTDSMVVAKIVRDKLYDNNNSFLTKKEVVKVVSSPTKGKSGQNKQSKAVTWLESQSGKVVTKKLINEFINYMNNENN